MIDETKPSEDCGDSRGRVLVVPFQNVSLKGILVKFCPIFSAISGVGRIRKSTLSNKREMND